MKDEIAAGLKNALERKQTLEAAMQSFINAGYNEADVQEAARSIGNSAMSLISPKTNQQSQAAPLRVMASSPMPVKSVPPLSLSSVSQKPMMQQKKEGVSKTLVIVLVIILVLVLGLLGATLMFKNQIAAALGY